MIYGLDSCPISSDGKSRDSVSRQYFHCVGLGLECSVLVSCLVETVIETVVI